MPQSLVTTEPNQPRQIVSTEFDNDNGWVGLCTHFYLLGIWQWLAWNRLKFLAQLIAALEKVLSKRMRRPNQSRLEQRRRDRETLRSYLKHHKHRNYIQLAILVMLWLSEQQASKGWNRTPKQVPLHLLVRIPKPPPVFLKGLSGFARTDTAPADLSFGGAVPPVKFML